MHLRLDLLGEGICCRVPNYIPIRHFVIKSFAVLNWLWCKSGDKEQDSLFTVYLELLKEFYTCNLPGISGVVN